MIDFSMYRDKGFDTNQLDEIKLGILARIDVAVYAKKEYFSLQMRQIRLGLESGVDTSVYADPVYDWFQMEEIRKGLESGVNIKKYSDVSVPYDKMRCIREGLENGVDLTLFNKYSAGVLRELYKSIKSGVKLVPFILEGYSEEQLPEIRESLEMGVDVSRFISKEMRGVAIREVALGLKNRVDVSVYTGTKYNWRQMKQIRLGLEKQLDVSYYLNSLYDWEQMREIRQGLESGVDVVKYSSFVFPAAEMAAKRTFLELNLEKDKDAWIEKLIEGLGKVEAETADKSEDKTKSLDERLKDKDNEFEDFNVFLSRDEMELYIAPKGKPHPISKVLLDEAMRRYEVTTGIIDEAVADLVMGEWTGSLIKIASGVYPVQGEDGWYEFKFRTSVARTPKELPDGSVDFHDIEWFETVRKDQCIAIYHPAEQGNDGYTVTGTELKAKQGYELPVLGGGGFYTDASGREYYASMDGIIEYGLNKIIISKLLILDEVSLASGDVNFDGNVFVKGNVTGGMNMTVTGDIVIDGYVEKVNIECKGNVVLHKGVNSSDSGQINAEKDVVGTFFESAKVHAGGNIRVNYALNSELYAEGSVIVNGKRGLLVGGVTCAERSIAVKELGNYAGVATTLRLEMHDMGRRRLSAMEKKVASVLEELAILKNARADMEKRYTLEQRSQMELFTKVENAIYTKEVESADLLREKGALELAMRENANAEVVVYGDLYEGVFIQIENAKMQSRRVRGVRIRKHNNKLAMFTL